MKRRDGRRNNGKYVRGLSIEQRFWNKVSGGSYEDCWLWTASLVHGTGYASFQLSPKVRINAHRWAYQQMVGEVPAGLQLDHLCRVRHCVNPWHLEPVSPQVNLLRGVCTGAIAIRRGTCPYGHSREEFGRVYAGRTQCAACNRIRCRLYNAMTPEERAERKATGLPVVDLAAYFATQSQERAA